MTQANAAPPAPAAAAPQPRPAPRRAPGPFALTYAAIVAMAIALVLQFAAAAKLMGPNPKEVLLQAGPIDIISAKFTLKDPLLLDQAVAAGELLAVVLLLTLRRKWWSWPPVILLFSAFAGYAYYAHEHGVPCGCFAKLWVPPAKVSAIIDLSFVTLGLFSALALRARWWAIVGVAVLAPLLGYAGYSYAHDHLPPAPTTAVGQTAPDKLLASELMADIVSQPAGGPLWYIFVYDPGCSVCEAMKPTVDGFGQAYDNQADAPVRIRQFSIPDLEAKLKLGEWEWAPTPTVLLIKDGKIVHKWNGQEAPIPDPEFVTKAATGQFAAGQ